MVAVYELCVIFVLSAPLPIKKCTPLRCLFRVGWQYQSMNSESRNQMLTPQRAEGVHKARTALGDAPINSNSIVLPVATMVQSWAHKRI